MAPSATSVYPLFGHVIHDAALAESLVAGAQRLRGSVYLADGALQPHQLCPEGRYRTPEDARSWHLLFLNKRHEVSACVWFLHHGDDPSFNDLRVCNSAVAHDDEWREHLWLAVESELAQARAEGLSFAEIGGWAVSQESRRTVEGLVLALAAYSLGRLLGGTLGMTTATVRHASSSILQRLGGTHIEANGVKVPPYYDHRYDCTMELLRFDSRHPSPKYAGLVERLGEALQDVAVVTATSRQSLVAASPFGLHHQLSVA